MRKLATIQKIEGITPIEGKDRIVLARIQGWDVIVGTDFKVGDEVVYIQYDTILPDKPEFEFLRKRCWSPKWNGHRIRNMFMGGVFSQGIVFSLDILPEGNYKVGDDVTDIIGVKKYDPEAFTANPSNQNSKQSGIYRLLMRYGWFRKLFGGTWKEKRGKFPENIKKTDEDNVQVVFNSMPKDHTWTVTEKIEGQSVTMSVETIKFGFFKKRDYKVFSRNCFVGEGGSNWGIVSKKYDLRKKLLKEKVNYTIQGEIAGPGIQKNIYGFDDLELFVFSVIETDTGRRLDFEETIMLCYRWGLKTVPLLDDNFVLPDSSDEIIDMSTGQTIVGNNKNQIREGIVFRSEQNPKLSFKARSPEYLKWWDKKEK